MGKHTKAPWRVMAARVGGYAIAPAPGLDMVVMGIDEFGNFGPIRKESDANLIAASPKLLLALENMVKWFGKYPEFVPAPDKIEECRKAICSAYITISEAKGNCNE